MRALLVAAGVLLASACTAHRPQVALDRRLDLTLPGFDGQELSLASLRGKVVLVEVWASWCRPCRDSLPFYADLRTALQPRGFEFMGVNIDADPRAAASFLQQAGLVLPTMRDPHAATIAAEVPIPRMPLALLLDRSGKVRHVHEGFHPKDRSGLRAMIETLLAEAPAE